jgi:hypothetical protein
LLIHAGCDIFICLQYEIYVKNNRRGRNEPAETIQMFYGQLQYILECHLLRVPSLNLKKPQMFLLALVVPCKAYSKDATREPTAYSTISTSIVIDLQAIGCIMGQVKRGKEWGIIDHSGKLARTVFVELEDVEVDE